MGGSLEASEMAQFFEEFPEYRSCTTFVETGTHEGGTISLMARMFPTCHTIELSEYYHELSKNRYSPLGIHFHLGDSGVVLCSLSKTLNDDCVFFLDAHFSHGKTARGDKDVPLAEELASISARNKGDVIIIDDVRLFGTSGGEDWGAISTEMLLKSLKPRIPKEHFIKNDRLYILLNKETKTNHIETPLPPRDIPAHLRGAFTMNNTIPVVSQYYDNRSTEMSKKTYSIKDVTTFMYQVFLGATVGYGITDFYLYQALKTFPVRGKKTVVVGSQSPWYESVALANGASSVTTIEYQPIESEHPLITTLTPEQFEKNPLKFDIGFSISTFEHDGLGRYGDPVSPNADLIAMQRMRSIINPGGLLFLAVPTGADCLAWNAHRIYGKIRLPLLLQDWSLIGTFGLSDELLEKNGWEQPILVLKNDAPL
jgi:hypothetical protein